jgi:putative superfamily III holin-X
MKSENSRSIPELFSDAMAQLAKLIGNEFELVRTELSEKVGQVGRGAAMMGAGAIILIPALIMLLFAASAALTEAGLSEPLSYLVTGGGALIISAALILIGMSRLSGDALKPSVALDQVERDKIALKEMVR